MIENLFGAFFRVSPLIVFIASQNRPLPPPLAPLDQRQSRAGHRASTLGSGEDVPHVARIPAAATRCCHASVVESVGDLLQRGRACLLHLLYDRQHRACEAFGLSFTGLTTAAANGIEVRVAQFYTACLGGCQRRLGTLRDQRALLPSVEEAVDTKRNRVARPTNGKPSVDRPFGRGRVPGINWT